MVTPSKEIDVFNDLELLYNVNRLTAPGNRTPPAIAPNISSFFIFDYREDFLNLDTLS